MNRDYIFESIFDMNPNFVIAECDEQFFGETLEPEDLDSIKERMIAFLEEDDTETHEFKAFSFDTVSRNNIKDAFKDQDGKQVPLKWGSRENVEIIGTAELNICGDGLSISIDKETYEKLMEKNFGNESRAEFLTKRMNMPIKEDSYE